MILRRGDAETGRRGDIRPRQRDSGFALLLVFALAAAAAVMLYMELPRVAFEAQREREQLLIERGEQYQRAIQLYFRKFKQYPASLEQLDNTNNIRFLRRRYLDPLTGKDEWRLIHVGPGGVFTDSLTRKPKKDDKKQENTNTFITEGPDIGATLAEGRRASGAPPRRPSEGGQPQPGSDVAGQPAGLAGDPTQQGAVGQTAAPPPVPPTAVSGFPGVPANPFNPGAPAGVPMPGAMQPGMAQPDGTPQDTSPGSGQSPQPGMDPNQPGANQAADLIRNLLTRPRAFPGNAGAGMAGSQIGGGIAGVASKVEKQSIKIYNEHDQYNEWEFIYDFTKDRTGAGRLAGAMGAGDPRLSQQQGMQPGGPFGGPFPGQPGPVGQAGFGGPVGPGGFGGPTGFGGQPGFGTQPGAAGGFGPGASGPPSSDSGGGIGSGFGSGFGSTTPPQTRQPQQPGIPRTPPQPGPQPGPIPPPPPPPPANPPQ